MAQPYVGEIRMFAGNFPPVGWEFCDGRLLPIAENETLFQLIGTAFGGDGQTTFAVPDLRGRWAVGSGTPTAYATTGGAATVTLTQAQIPVHSHVPQASVAAGTTGSPAGATWAAATTPAFVPPDATPTTAMAADALGATGGNQPHENRPPYLAVSFIISLFGIFPTPT